MMTITENNIRHSLVTNREVCRDKVGPRLGQEVSLEAHTLHHNSNKG